MSLFTQFAELASPSRSIIDFEFYFYSMNQVDFWVCWKVLLWRRVCFSAIFVSVLALRYFHWLLSLDFRHFLFSSAWFYFHLMFNDDRSMSLALLMRMRARLCAIHLISNNSSTCRWNHQASHPHPFFHFTLAVNAPCATTIALPLLLVPVLFSIQLKNKQFWV